MRRILDVRVLQWYLKLAYVVGLWVAGYFVGALFGAFGTPPLLGSNVKTLVTLAGVLLGARSRSSTGSSPE